MVLRIATLIAAVTLCTLPLSATPLSIKRYEPSPTMFFGPDAAELDFFFWGDSLARAELFSGSGNPGDDGGYETMGSPATGTKVVLDLAGVGPFDPSLATLTFDVRWTVPIPPNGVWSNGFFDFVEIVDINGLTRDSVSAGALFGCEFSGEPCQAPDDLSREAEIFIPMLTDFLAMGNNEIEVVIDYYDGDLGHQLGPVSTDPPFTVDNFDLVVPEPACLKFLLLSMAVAWCRNFRPKVG